MYFGVDWTWDATSPLFSEHPNYPSLYFRNKLDAQIQQFELKGSTATKMKNPGCDVWSHDRNSVGGFPESYSNCVMINPLMKSGKHRIAFKFIAGPLGYMEIEAGVVKDGTKCDENPTTVLQLGEDYDAENEGGPNGDGISDNGWCMGTCGRLSGNGMPGSFNAGRIIDGQILSLELDLDAGTLRFWRGGVPHGPGFTGITGQVRWAASMCYEGSALQIIKTPELQQWAPWDGQRRDAA
jgi:hypothetical protein